MNQMKEPERGWKQKFVREMADYWTTFIYLALFFGAFTWYRRLVLAEYHIAYLHYGIALIEAAVLAKVILIGDAIRLGKRVEERPLIYTTLYKALVFTIWVAIFKVIEHTLSGIFEGKGWAGGLIELRKEGMDALLAECLITFCAFIPFFAFRELGREIGEGKIGELFFRGRSAVGRTKAASRGN